MTDSGSMTNPSEAIIEAVGRAIMCEVVRYEPNAVERYGRAAITAMQAATPAAPVQDDDAELVAFLRAEAAHHDKTIYKDTVRAFTKAADRLERLTPDRVTPLVEALRSINRRASPTPDRTLGDCADELMWIADEARLALRDGGFDA